MQRSIEIAILFLLTPSLLSYMTEDAFSADGSGNLPRPHGPSSQKHDFHAFFCCPGTRFFPRGRLGSRVDCDAGDPNHSGDLGEKHAICFKGPWLDIGKDPEKIAARVYDVAGPDLLENGSVGEDVQREMIADASVRIKPAQRVLREQVFDFSIVHKVSQTLK